ncbi:hypothetical protein [Marinimicrobium locisalis]|uniref:hypothetical protein n=1 Tax=Marinimicrobium locisalis TaxID=546022 RepID=UPI003221E9CF
MSDEIYRLAEARQKRGWTKQEIEAFAERRARELRSAAERLAEPEYLASGTQKTIREMVEDESDEPMAP